MAALRRAVRIISVEYIQNLPILVGLMIALQVLGWLESVAVLALGAAGTAGTIALTERVKLQKTMPERPADLLVNAVTFFAGTVFYVGYFRLLRNSFPYPVVADMGLGLGLGLMIGIVQGFGVGQPGVFSRDDLLHTVGFMGVGSVLCVIIGVIAGWKTPLAAAMLLCIPMTLIIVRMDYWSLILSGARDHEY